MKILRATFLSVFLLLPSMPLLAGTDPAANVSSVNINTADASVIAKVLKGVGESKAKAIIEYREINGDFKSAEELTEIKGIGVKLVDDNRARIKL